MSLPIPSADKIISTQRCSNRVIKGVWEKVTAKLLQDMDVAKNAMSKLNDGSLVDPNKFGCSFFKVISVERDTIQLHFKVSGMMLTLQGDDIKSFRVNRATASEYIGEWSKYIDGLKIDQDDFAKQIHAVAKEKAKPKPQKKGQPAPSSTWNAEQDRWILD